MIFFVCWGIMAAWSFGNLAPGWAIVASLLSGGVFWLEWRSLRAAARG